VVCVYRRDNISQKEILEQLGTTIMVEVMEWRSHVDRTED